MSLDMVVLDKAGLWVRAVQKAKKDAAALYPDGRRRRKAERELSRKYYNEYISPSPPEG